jgi:hypothetical protein
LEGNQMAALYDPRYDFTPAHTAGDRSIALAERDPAFLQFKQTAMKKYSNLSPAAIANLFHRSKEQRNILPSLDVDAIAENDIKAETASTLAPTSDAKPVFHMGLGSIAALEAKQNDERNAIGALDEYYSNMTADQYAQEVAAQKNLTPTLTAAARIKEQQERERLALALSAPSNQPAADAPVLSAESSSYDHIPFAANAETLGSPAGNGAGELPSMQDAQRMMDINNPLGSTGGALTDTNTGNGTGNTVVTKDNGALTAPSKPTQSTVRSTTGGYTGNARGSDLPDMQIGLNERLMRMGAAGLAAGGQGSLAQMGAMFGASADVNQANRQAEMEAFGIEEERRQAHAARVAALAASGSKGADAATDFSSMASSLTEMEGLYAMLGQENLTGPLMGTVGKWAEGAGLFDFFRDKPKDAMKAYARFQLQGLKVDDTLLRVAQTKGAISDAEMKLFQSDTPSMTDSEGVWQRYLNERMVVLRKALAAQGYALNAPVKVGGATITPIAD